MVEPSKEPRPVLPPSVPCPTRGRPLFVRLLYPREGQPVEVIALGHAIYGILTHWWDGAPLPCRGLEAGCPGCVAGSGTRWNGYLAAVEWPSLRRRIVVLTESGYRCATWLHKSEGNLRGVAIRLERMGKGKNAPVKLTRLKTPAGVNLPAAFPVPDALAVLWRLTTRTVYNLVEPLPEEPSEEEPVAPHHKNGRKHAD